MASGVWAQPAADSAKISKIAVFDDQGKTSVEVTLSSPTPGPEVTVLTNPDRILLVLHGVLPGGWKALEVGRYGVKKVRASVSNSRTVPNTHLVVELSGARPYVITTGANKIVLTLLPVQIAGETKTKKRQGAAAAASAPLMSRIRRKSDTSAQQTADGTQNTDATSATSASAPVFDAQAGFFGCGNQKTACNCPTTAVECNRHTPSNGFATFAARRGDGDLIPGSSSCRRTGNRS